MSAYLPVETAPKDGRYIIAVYRSLDGYAEQLHGRAFVVRHEGETPSGYDLGWALFPGHGGVPDKCLSGWAPLPTHRNNANSYISFTDGMQAAAEICGSLAELEYDDADGFEAATGCEAAIMRCVKEQRRAQAMSAGTAKTEGLGGVSPASAVAESDAPALGIEPQSVSKDTP